MWLYLSKLEAIHSTCAHPLFPWVFPAVIILNIKVECGQVISRPTPRLLSFALCLEWINGIYNTLDTGCLECYRPHASVNTTTPKIDRKHMHCRNMLEIQKQYIP